MASERNQYRFPVAEIRGATPDDFEAVLELLDTRSRAVFGVSEVAREHLWQSWELPATDHAVADVDGRVVGYAALDEGQELALAAPDPRIGDELLAHALEQARRRGFGEVTLTAAREDEPLVALARRNAFTPDREVLRMWRRLDGILPAPRPPEDVAVRTYEDADAETVHALLDEAYSGWDSDYVRRSHDGWLRWMTRHDDFDPALWFLAERDGELVACALHWREHQRRGWVKDVAVRESERGRGLGRALLEHGFRAYAARGVKQVGLKVDSTNPTGALRLYERLGFRVDRRYGIWMRTP